eukprot:2007099-Alexandrium_andersonii.AAC.1
MFGIARGSLQLLRARNRSATPQATRAGVASTPCASKRLVLADEPNIARSKTAIRIAVQIAMRPGHRAE